MSAAQVALWTRKHALRRPDLDAALWKRRTLVKTSCMRQTLHLLPAAEFSLYITAIRRSRVDAVRRVMSRFGITPKEANGLNEAVVEALRRGPLTQRELTKSIVPEVSPRVRAWMERVWSVFKPALAEGLICCGPNRAQEVTFVRVDQWLPKQKAIAEREAQPILLRRYLRAYGPATLQDFSKWSGIPGKDARPVWGSLQDEMREVSIEDQRGWMLEEDFEQLANRDPGEPGLRLLPSFDPYLLGHASKDHLVDPRFYKQVYRGAGWISPVVLLGGRVVGTWSGERRGKRLSLRVESFENLSRKLRAAVEEEAAGLGSFLETPWELRFGK